MGCVLKALVAVEAQLRSGPLFLPLHGQTNGVQDQIHRLLGSGFVGNDAVVIEIPDHGQIQYALPGVDVGDVRYPFAVGPVRMELPVQQVLVPVYLLSYLLPFPPAADLRQQIIFLHDPQHGFGIAEDILPFQPQPHPPVAVGAEAAFPLLCDEPRESRILFRLAQAMDEGIVAASGYCEEFAHDGHWILCSVTIDDAIFYPCPHFLCSAENPAAVDSPYAAAGSHRPVLPRYLLARCLSSAGLWAVGFSPLPAWP